MHSPAPQRLAAADARRAAAARAARAAAASRRKARAARRLVLTLALLAVTAVTWALVGVVAAPMAVAIVPTALFLGVLVLSRRAAKQAKAADARLAEEVERARRADQARAARIAASTHARESERPAGQSSLRIDVDPARLMAEEIEAQEAETSAAQSEQAWTPVPVPAPVYTMKPAAPRREVEPVQVGESGVESSALSAGSPATADSAAGTEVSAAPVTVGVPAASARAGVDGRERAQERAEVGDVTPTTATPSVNLQEVLERRRAVGQ